MYCDSFMDHLASQGCSWVFDSRLGAWYRNKHNQKGCSIKKEPWLPAKYIKVVCAELDVDVPPEVAGNNFDAYRFIRE